MKFYLFLFIFEFVFSFSKRFLDINRDSFNDYIELNKYNNNKKLLLIFYKDNCTFCEEALNIIENEVIPDYRINNNNLIEFGKINCDIEQNIWLNIQFKIKRIPYIILIIGNYFYELNYKPDKYVIKDFIDNINIENDVYNKKKIPKQFGNIQKLIIIINYIIRSFRYYFYKIFRIPLHKNIIIVILILLLISFFWLLKILFCFVFENIKKIRNKFKKKEKKNINNIVENIKEKDLNNISDDLSGSENLDKNDKNNNNNNNYINEELFNQTADDEEMKKKYKKKIE